MIEGEARGLSPGEQHHPLRPSHPLTPHPICLGHHGCRSPPPPRHSPTPPFYQVGPKPSHNRSVSGFWPKPHPSASHWRTHCPPGTFVIPTCTHHLLEAPYIAISRGMPETKPRLLGFGFWPKPRPQPRIGERIAHPHLLPPGTPLHCHFMRHT